MNAIARLRRRWRKWRNRTARRVLNTRAGREILVNAISPRILSMTADAGDHRITFSPHDYIGRKIYRKGHFERDHVERLMDTLRARGLPATGSVLLELGGNIGTQTLYLMLTGAFRHAVTVEPDPRNFQLLTHNIEQNNLAGRITAVPCGAGESEGTLQFFQHRDNHGKSSMIRQSPNDIAITVPVKPVSVILTEATIAPIDIGLVWIDIEGYEPVAMRSMEELLRRRTPIYLEFSPVFYGTAATRNFAAHLARFYEDCIVFRDDRQIEMKVIDLPLGDDQFDVLLLP